MSNRTKFGKTVDVEKPYATFKNPQGWEWRVLKTYQSAKKERDNPYARWFVAAKSPMTYDRWEYGDTYAREVEQYGHLVSATSNWLEEYLTA
jgi:hypothetical protein